MPSVLGYFKPDINKQNVQSQLHQLKASGACKIYQEIPSDANRNTPQLDQLMAEALDGDTVVVTSLDRIAKNTKHLLEIVESLNAAGVTFKVINNGIDTSTSHGKVLPVLLRAIVDFERQVVRDRQSVGIAKAKREGRYKGRKPTARLKTDEVLALNDQGLTRQKIADELGIGVASVYRILKANSMSKTSHMNSTKKLGKTVKKPKRVKRKPTPSTDTEQLSFF